MICYIGTLHESEISPKEGLFQWVLKEILSMNTWSKLMCSLANGITKQKICMIKVLLVQRNGFSSEFSFKTIRFKLILTFRDVEGTRFFSDYPNRDNSMQHLACFAGGMFAYGAKFEETEEEDLKVTTLTDGHLVGSSLEIQRIFRLGLM